MFTDPGFHSCQKPTPAETFATAVLSTNLMHGFAGRGFQSQLEQPSVKLAGEQLDHEVAMKRWEIVDDKIRNLEDAFGKIRTGTSPEGMEDAGELNLAVGRLFSSI